MESQAKRMGDRIMLDYHDSKQLVTDALIEFFPNWVLYLDPDDLDNFLREHKNVCVVSGQEGLPIGVSHQSQN